MQVSGKIKVINATQQVSASFQKRELVVTTDEQYPQHILIEFNQDKCDILNNYSVGQEVVVSINLRGREWVNPQGETRYFNSIQGWRIEKIGENNAPAQQPQAQASAPAVNQQPPQSPATDFKEEEHDDLPF